jgi:hypothetical protein
VQYQVTAFPSDTGPGVVPVPFTLEQVRGLGDGEVVIGKPGTRSEVVSEEEWREEAEDSC